MSLLLIWTSWEHFVSVMFNRSQNVRMLPLFSTRLFWSPDFLWLAHGFISQHEYGKLQNQCNGFCLVYAGESVFLDQWDLSYLAIPMCICYPERFCHVFIRSFMSLKISEPGWIPHLWIEVCDASRVGKILKLCAIDVSRRVDVFYG